jgi:hypothetical protein
MSNPPLPHTIEKPEKEDPFVSVELEMTKRYAAVHPEAAEGFFLPARDISNAELEKAEKSDDDTKKDSD